LEHPNIVPVHELGLNADGKVYFTMKLVKGESLDAIIDGIADKNPECVRKYPLSHLLQIFLKVCDAIAFAHSKGVIHRDLKPENVMVGRFGEVLVMDWGLSKVKGREDAAQEALVETIRSEKAMGKTLSGEVMGTPSYMPPEQASGKVERIDERSDIFALGAMLYMILTHEPPYTGGTVQEVLTKAVTCAYKAPRVKSPWNRIPKELQSICLKAMAPTKEGRYGSVEALVEDVRAYLDHRPVKAHRSGPLTRFLRFVQRHPAGSLAGGVALILLCLGGALTGVLLQRTEAERARAREKEALAEAESARADAASVRAQIAEADREKAEVRATDAEDALEKGRLVSAVFRSAEVELGETLRALKTTYYSNPTPEQFKESRERHWEKVEAFGRSVPNDSASRATWLAAKGWMALFAGEPEKAFSLFLESKKRDPDVVYGWFFEGMYWLTSYFREQDWPSVQYEEFRPCFGGIPPETEVMRRALQRCEQILSKVEEKAVWGESSAGDFRRILSGIRALQKKDLDAVDRGLSHALSVPEMIWMREEILHVRVKIRYIRNDLEGGITDARRLLDQLPSVTSTHFYLGNLLLMLALQECRAGRDPRPIFEKAITAFTRAIELKANRQVLQPRIIRGVVHTQWALYLLEQGKDPREPFRKALADFDIPPETVLPTLNPSFHRAIVYLHTAYYLDEKGEDPQEAFERAIDELSAALRREPGNIEILRGRAVSRYNLGLTRKARGRDPSRFFQLSMADFDQALQKEKKHAGIYKERGNLLSSMASHALGLGRDPRQMVEKALQDFETALRLDPNLDSVRKSQAEAYLLTGQLQERLGADPLSAYGKGIEICNEAIRLGEDSASIYSTRGALRLISGIYLGSMQRDSGDLLKKAEEDFNAALEKDSTSAYAFNYRAKVRTHRATLEG
ncbi:MAG: protein kinase domain-containing protein, partial [Planctomycetota bacterium]